MLDCCSTATGGSLAESESIIGLLFCSHEGEIGISTEMPGSPTLSCCCLAFLKAEPVSVSYRKHLCSSRSFA